MKPKAHRSPKDRQLARDTLRNQVLALSRDYLELLDSPRALSVYILLSSKEDEQIARLGCNPLHYNLPAENDKFRRDYAATKLLSKWDKLSVPWDPKEVALQTAISAEKQCSKTNRRIRVLRSFSRPLRPANARALSLLLESQRIIRKILGSPPRDVHFSGWSSGRTTRSKGPALSALEKFRSKPDITAQAYALGCEAIRVSPLWGQQLLQADGPVSVLTKVGTIDIAEGNVACIVPKNAKTGRFICYEPHLNIALQLTVGKVMKRRLLSRAGVNLSDQSDNRRLALEGSRTQLLATIDLSSASDTIAAELVQFLLPEEWYSLLDRLRSRSTNYFGVWRRNHKFSAMGCGFTFELESLIFFALCKAVARDRGIPFTAPVDGCVFGDDIVVPTSIYDEVIRLLRFCGFTPNQSKSFATGPFRESCGVDAVSGWVITPPMIRPGQKGLNLSIAFHNRVRDYCRNVFGGLPREWNGFLASIRQQYPGPMGPSFYGDGHYHTNFDEARPKRAFSERGWEPAWFFKTRRPFTRSRLGDFMVDHGKYDFRATFGNAALLAATFDRRRPVQGLRIHDPMLHMRVNGIEALAGSRNKSDPSGIYDTLIRGGSYTDSLLRVLSQEWESLEVL